MRIIQPLIFLCFFLCAFGKELNLIIQDQPVPTELNEVETETLLFYLEHLGPDSPEHFYRIASFYIQTGELDKAEAILQQLIEVYPDDYTAITQLGFIYLWERKWKKADELFRKAWDLNRCNSSAAIGLIRVALVQGEGKNLTKEMADCHWEDPDVPLYLGILNIRLKRYDEAEKALNDCLRISHHYRDAYFELAHLYVLQKKYKEAEEIYERYPDDAESYKGQARLAERQGDEAKAESLYRSALEKKPDDIEAREGLAQNLTIQLKYKEAQKQYDDLLKKQTFKQGGRVPLLLPNEDQTIWIRSLDVRSHTRPAIKLELDYTDAKEDDPTLRVPVVKDYYFTEKLTLFFPIFDRWRLDAQQLYYHQRENDILSPPSVNYSAFVNGGSLISHYFFARDWKWDVTLKGVKATGFQNGVNYPFHSSALFEPGTILMYSDEWNRFVLDGHVEDQIIKDFFASISQLLRIDVYQGEYGFHPPVYMHPNIEIGAAQDFYHDAIHNWKQYQKAKAEVDFFCPELRLTYLFEHGKFKKLTANYFTYRKQIQHTLSLKYKQDFYSKGQFELLWDHIWQSNRDVILPVGNLLFIGPQLYLIGNKYTALARYRFRDRLQFEISGHYYTLTLPYHDWNLRGFLHWQF